MKFEIVSKFLWFLLQISFSYSIVFMNRCNPANTCLDCQSIVQNLRRNSVDCMLNPCSQLCNDISKNLIIVNNLFNPCDICSTFGFCGLDMCMIRINAIARSNAYDDNKNLRQKFLELKEKITDNFYDLQLSLRKIKNFLKMLNDYNKIAIYTFQIRKYYQHSLGNRLLADCNNNYFLENTNKLNIYNNEVNILSSIVNRLLDYHSNLISSIGENQQITNDHIISVQTRLVELSNYSTSLRHLYSKLIEFGSLSNQHVNLNLAIIDQFVEFLKDNAIPRTIMVNNPLYRRKQVETASVIDDYSNPVEFNESKINELNMKIFQIEKKINPELDLDVKDLEKKIKHQKTMVKHIDKQMEKTMNELNDLNKGKTQTQTNFPFLSGIFNNTQTAKDSGISINVLKEVRDLLKGVVNQNSDKFRKLIDNERNQSNKEAIAFQKNNTLGLLNENYENTLNSYNSLESESEHSAHKSSLSKEELIEEEKLLNEITNLKNLNKELKNKIKIYPLMNENATQSNTTNVTDTNESEKDGELSDFEVTLNNIKEEHDEEKKKKGVNKLEKTGKVLLNRLKKVKKKERALKNKKDQEEFDQEFGLDYKNKVKLGGDPILIGDDPKSSSVVSENQFFDSLDKL